jgi:GT2 family glycosyltransferase
MTQTVVAIVIPVYRGITQIGLCLKSIEANEYKKFRIILVDHSPDNEIGQWVKSEFPDVICLRGSPDQWWSAATNMGIRYATDHGYELIMLLNHDSYLKPDTISRLVAHLQYRPGTIIGPVQHHIHSNTRVYRAYSCFLLGFPTLAFPRREKMATSIPTLLRTRLIIGGRGVLINAAVFGNVGMFDETGLPHYGADHDFYIRCRKAGIPLYVATDAEVDVDDENNRSRSALGALTLRQFAKTLADRKSHLNIKELKILYKKYFPVPGLYIVGLVLNLTRYLAKYAVKRLIFMAGVR